MNFTQEQKACLMLQTREQEISLALLIVRVANEGTKPVDLKKKEINRYYQFKKSLRT